MISSGYPVRYPLGIVNLQKRRSLRRLRDDFQFNEHRSLILQFKGKFHTVIDPNKFLRYVKLEKCSFHCILEQQYCDCPRRYMRRKTNIITAVVNCRVTEKPWEFTSENREYISTYSEKCFGETCNTCDPARRAPTSGMSLRYLELWQSSRLALDHVSTLVQVAAERACERERIVHRQSFNKSR